MPTLTQWRRLALTALASGCVLAAGGRPAGARAANQHTLTGVNEFGWGFDGPDGLAVANGKVWVANYWAGSVTELKAGAGSLVTFISDLGYGFAPSGVTLASGDVWVTNGAANTVSEFPAG